MAQFDKPVSASESVRRSGALPGRARRVRRLCARAAAVVVAALVLVVGWIRFACFADEPVLVGRPAVLDARLVTDEAGVRRFGAAWFVREPGLSRLHVEGDPFTIGFAGAKLTGELFAEQETSLWDAVHAQFPSRLALLGVGAAVLLNNRTLPDFVELDRRLEILGLARGGPDPLPALGPRYHRILNYHAAHDIAHWVMDRPARACTAFAASGRRTPGGALIVGRNFDFEAGAHFDVNKVVYRVVPQGGRRFLSVAWPGMAGAVTGLNDARVYCSVNGARSSDMGRIGTPVSLVVRDVLERAGDLDEAVDIVRRARVFVSDSYLVADGKSGRAAVVEKTPERCAVRYSEDGLLLLANHFESDDFAADEGRKEGLSEGTTGARRARLAELTDVGASRMDVGAAVAVLRDRRGVGGKPLPLGHREAIDALIAAHSVVCDATAGVLWVSRGPHTLGDYVALSLDAFEESAVPPIPADPLLAGGGYARLQEVRALIRGDRDLRARGAATAASRAGLRRAVELAPDDPDALAAEAVAREADGDPAGALEAWRRALDARPAHSADRATAQAALERLAECRR